MPLKPIGSQHRRAMRGGDDTLAYTQSGEIVLPRTVQERFPDLAHLVLAAIGRAGQDPSRYVVGSPDGSYNPQTGAQEFFWDSVSNAFSNAFSAASPAQNEFYDSMQAAEVARQNKDSGSQPPILAPKKKKKKSTSAPPAPAPAPPPDPILAPEPEPAPAPAPAPPPGPTPSEMERERASNFANSLMGSLAPLGVDARSLTIDNLSGLNDFERQLAGIQAQRQGFSSPFMAEWGGSVFDGVDANLADLMQAASGLREGRSAEQRRIQDFGAGLYSQADELSALLGGVSIADMDAISRAQTGLQTAMRDAQRFSSPLGFDFSTQLGGAGLGGVQGQLEQLLAQRSAEEARIQEAQASARGLISGLDRLTQGLSIYDLDNLLGVRGDIDATRRELGGFSSVLPFSFDTSGLDAASGRLEDLFSQRSEALGGIQSRAPDVLAGLSDIPLYDEAALTGRRSALGGLAAELGAFRGSDVDPIREQLTGGLGSVDARLQELGAQRASLEQQAQQLMERINSAAYYSTGGLAGDEAAVQQMRDQIELYNAQQALDELAAMEQRINSERSRLVTDEGTSAQRRAAQQSAVLGSLGPGGVPSFASSMNPDPFNRGFYSRYMFTAPEEEFALATPQSGAFSQALGLGGF
jgi:hypothetical protein